MGRFGSAEALRWLSTHGVHADSVEMKTLVVPPAGAAAEALTGRHGPTWSVRQSYLLDTADLDLLRAGVEVRLRRRARGKFDLAVSARRRGTELGCYRPPGARVEYDVVPEGVWKDIEVRRDIDSAIAASVIAGSAKARELLSSTQCTWALTGGNETVDDARLSELRVHGPMVVRRVKVAATGLGLRRVDLEHFRFPSGRELVELSTRCCPREVPDTAAAFEALLAERDVMVAPEYTTKTAVWHDEIVGRRRG
ncbi:hypothetical protein EV188_101959 [Actinomycetospora succinea]|uniref:CYTH domain-containing protein n=1 Tax=Actinomycetospora succinea TaxID=663603 RepID=A0A4R6VSV1_9PSEU|nr:hypothetical protein [Actinomycetospora succinea]TDQ65707.1 hypothetical protein EV188_101959 [Actinomycetospora succinea]